LLEFNAQLIIIELLIVISSTRCCRWFIHLWEQTLRDSSGLVVVDGDMELPALNEGLFIVGQWCLAELVVLLILTSAELAVEET